MIPGGNTDSPRESSSFSRELSEAIPTEQARTVIVSRRESSAFSRGLSVAIPTEKCAPVTVSRRESSGAIQDDSWRKHRLSPGFRRYRRAQPTAKSGMYPCGIPAML